MAAIDREIRKSQGVTANPNSTPVRKTSQTANPNSTAGAGAPTGGFGTGAFRLGPRTPDRTWQDSARDGAFGTGARDLQKRRDLFSEMAKAKPEDRAGFQGRAAELGVTAGGWAAALGRLNMTGGAPAATAATTPKPGATAAFGADKANRNIATQGVTGAVADYSARKDQAKKDAFQQAAAIKPQTSMGGMPWNVAAPSNPIGRSPNIAAAAGFASPIAATPAPPPAPVAATPPTPAPVAAPTPTTPPATPWNSSAAMGYGKPSQPIAASPAPVQAQPTAQPKPKPTTAQAKPAVKWYENDMSNPDRFAGSPAGRGLKKAWGATMSLMDRKRRLFSLTE